MRESRLIVMAIFAVSLWMAAGYALAQEGQLAPVTGVTASDTPNDEGDSITIVWQLSPDDDKVSQYNILIVNTTNHGSKR